jgi:hypothetical protein
VLDPGVLETDAVEFLDCREEETIVILTALPVSPASIVDFSVGLGRGLATSASRLGRCDFTSRKITRP